MGCSAIGCLIPRPAHVCVAGIGADQLPKHSTSWQCYGSNLEL